nr:MAG TPA: hypothetical protein [Bacteriophage sp.]
MGYISSLQEPISHQTYRRQYAQIYLSTILPI